MQPGESCSEASVELIAFVALASANHTREEPDLPGHQARQFPYWEAGLQVGECHPCS